METKRLRDMGGLKNVTWTCIKCGKTLTNAEFTNLPKGDPVRVCSGCGMAGWFIDADTVQEKIGGFLLGDETPCKS